MGGLWRRGTRSFWWRLLYLPPLLLLLLLLLWLQVLHPVLAARGVLPSYTSNIPACAAATSAAAAGSASCT
jgi:hypothetical protein